MDKKRFGVMVDCSRNAVMKPEKVKEFVDSLVKFGYNTLMLYTEDTFCVNNEKYFGHLRGRYSKDELKEIDAYCKNKGVELIPCVQTLAHFNQLFQWVEYEKIHDIDDILTANDERTYQLLDNIFATVKECFSSNIINIGMDEAHRLGLGKYLDKNGYNERFDILNEHLKKVCSMCEKYGLKPIMWSDMFYRLANNGDYYGTNPIPDEIKKQVPKEVDLVYWDYYHSDKKIYRNIIKSHQTFDNGIWFAGGAWTWHGFAPFNGYTERTMRPAMQACRETGVDNIIITLWGDNGKETSFFSILPSLYYIKRIYDGETSKSKIKAEFKNLTGEDFDAMWKLDLPNEICGNKNTAKDPCKYVLYNDLFFGKFDYHMPDGGNAEYAKHAKTLKRLGKNSKYKYIFDCESNLCDVLSIKYGLGKKIKTAYKNGDKESLLTAVSELKLLERKLEKFYESFKVLWFTENKPNGFDVQDIRLGGEMRRVKSCRERLEEYLNGSVKELPELSEEILPFFDNGGDLIDFNYYRENATVNIL